MGLAFFVWETDTIPVVDHLQSKWNCYFIFRLEESWMGYHKFVEEQKWLAWKAAEERQLRALGVEESVIQRLREYDREQFNAERRYRQKQVVLSAYYRLEFFTGIGTASDRHGIFAQQS